VNALLTPFLRRVYVFLACAFLSYGAVCLVERSPWNRERLYRRLLAGQRDAQVSAAAKLVVIGGQRELLKALKAPSVGARDLASNALWELWFRAAGPKAYSLVQTANEAMNQNDLEQAMTLLDQLVRRYPSFAEGWNRRAIFHWQLGHYGRSIEDCRRVLRLNPDHFGAWQGMGLCQAELGDFSGACHSLVRAQKLNPRDEGIRRVLKRCLALRKEVGDRWRLADEHI
jgi:tetratricopeptide (TPR) repeat protein